MLEPRWILAAAEQLPETNGFCDLLCIARFLRRRGLLTAEQARDFLRPRLGALSDPFLLPQMDAAVARILRALTNQEKIVVYGDYDVDGVTSLALLSEILTAYGAKPALFLPSRMEEGYGLSREGIDRCWHEHSPKLLIAVDCGTASCAEIAEICARGADAIVVDHHEPKRDLPNCVALVNPKTRPDAGFCYLCSVGIVFKLCHALLKSRPLPDFDLRSRLDLVALGTVADIVPLEAENRILVHHGARELARGRLLGLKHLMQLAGVGTTIAADDIGFRLGPRLNAAGRLTTAETALRLLMTTEEEEAAALASELDGQNRERQTVEQRVFEAAEEKLAQSNRLGRAAIVVGEIGWHAGVLGIVAARLARKYHRPTVVIGFDETGLGKGSGRSIAGLSLVAALAKCENCLEKFGGHEMAAGLTIQSGRLDEFASQFEAACHSLLGEEDLRPRLHLDHELALNEITWELLRWHDLLQPFGNGNPQPLFVARAVEPSGPPQVVKEKHLILRLRQNGRSQRAVYFRGAESPLPSAPWDVAFRIGSDEYQGELRLQMQVEALRSAGSLA